MTRSYYLGCPVWSCAQWVGTLYRKRIPRSNWLEDYSSVFSAVEGNSTFYALPSEAIVTKWCETSLPGFRFALKFPRAITHDCRLVNADREVDAFLGILKILSENDRLGPPFLQLPPDFGPSEFEALASFCDLIPAEFPFAVEVRHHGFYDNGMNEERLNQLLRERGIDRVLFDSRGLYARPPETASERRSQGRKPRSPFRTTVTAKHPMVRFIGRDNVDSVAEWIEEWSLQTANWIKTGLTPYIFTHTPDDAYAPEFAQRFHTSLLSHLSDLPRLAEWPGIVESRAQPRQLELF